MLLRFWIFHFLIFWLTIIYTLLYKYINKFFNLNSDFELNNENFMRIIFCASLPLINILALTTAIYEDVMLYQKNNKK